MGAPLLNTRGEVIALFAWVEKLFEGRSFESVEEEFDPEYEGVVRWERAHWIVNIREDLKSKGIELGKLGEQKDSLSSQKFYDQGEILEALNRFSGIAEGEFAREALLIFSTEEQRTWLVTTSSNLYFLLDDQNTRELDSLVQRKVPLAEAQSYIKASNLNDRDKVIAIGASQIIGGIILILFFLKLNKLKK